VFKRYKSPLTINGEALSRLVTFRLERKALDVRWIDRHCAWPMCRVIENGVVVGFLMRRAARDFTWKDDDAKRRLLELQYAIRPVKDAWRQVPSLRSRQRRQLALRLAELIGRLHKWGVIIGDISDRNILWCVKPEVDVYLLDCDGIRVRGYDPVAEQRRTKDWDDPHQQGTPGLDNDRYKSALAISRVLTCEPYFQPSMHPSFVQGALTREREEEVRALLSIAARPRNRPTLSRWTDALGGGGSPGPNKPSHQYIPPAPVTGAGRVRRRINLKDPNA
jgi:hypothetical protein